MKDLESTLRGLNLNLCNKEQSPTLSEQGNDTVGQHLRSTLPLLIHRTDCTGRTKTNSHVMDIAIVCMIIRIQTKMLGNEKRRKIKST